MKKELAHQLIPHRDEKGIFIKADGEKHYIEPLHASNISKAWHSAIGGSYVALSK